MSVSINGTGGITFADASTQSTGGYTGFRNRIINGAMMIDQRNAGATINVNGATQWPVDRFAVFLQASTGSTIGQSTATLSTSFTKSLGVVIGTGAAPSAAQPGYIDHRIEGNNIGDLKFGTINASPITISFWVYSSLTGTFGGAVRNSAVNRCYVYSYTINVANTWEYKTVTIPGDTSGTWLTDTGVGMYVSFDIGEGSNRSTSTTGSWLSTNTPGLSSGVKLCATSGATFYITGVQLEKGSVATPFEFRPYGQELALCQRYYQVLPVQYGTETNTSISRNNYSWVEKRAAPTITLAAQYWNGSGWNNPSSSIATGGTGGGYVSVSGTNVRFVGHGTSQYQGIFEAGSIILNSEL